MTRDWLVPETAQQRPHFVQNATTAAPVLKRQSQTGNGNGKRRNGNCQMAELCDGLIRIS